MCPVVLYLPRAALQSKQITLLCIEWSQKYLDTPSMIVFFNRIICHCRKSSQCHGWGRPGYFLLFLFFSNEMLKFRLMGACLVSSALLISLVSIPTLIFCLVLWEALPQSPVWQYLKPKRRIYLKYSPACSLSTCSPTFCFNVSDLAKVLQ